MGSRRRQSLSVLTTRCTNCNSQPPAGFAYLACGAALGGHHCRIDLFLGQVDGAPRRTLAALAPDVRPLRANPETALARGRFSVKGHLPPGRRQPLGLVGLFP